MANCSRTVYNGLRAKCHNLFPEKNPHHHNFLGMLKAGPMSDVVMKIPKNAKKKSKSTETRYWEKCLRSIFGCNSKMKYFL